MRFSFQGRRCGFGLFAAFALGLFSYQCATASPQVDGDPQPATATASDEGGVSNVAPDAAAQTDGIGTGKTVVIDPASLKGVRPGKSTADEMRQAWGQPLSTRKADDAKQYVYRIAPFQRIEAFVSKADVVTSIVLHLDKKFPPEAVAKQLKFDDVIAVEVRDPQGQPLGRVFPERGVLFSYTPDDRTPKVARILLEPISAESFVLRAEKTMGQHYQKALADLDFAIAMNAKHHRARWLKAQILNELGRQERALAMIDEASRQAPRNASYRLTRAELLAATGKLERAIELTRQVVDTDGVEPQIKARGTLQLGDLLLRRPQRDHKQAMKHYLEALRLAEPLSKDRRVEVRRAVRRVLVDLHLSVATSIAQGNWTKKETVVPQWLLRGVKLAEAAIKERDARPELRFHIAVRSLRAYAAVGGRLDASKLSEQTLALGRKLIADSDDPLRKQRLKWELAGALHDAVIVSHARGKQKEALRYGELGLAYAQQGGESRINDQTEYLIGRYCFRIGTVHAILGGDHAKALSWYRQATERLRKPAPSSVRADVGQQGEALISMGVSFWHEGEKDKAVQLTDEGVKLVEKAVADGELQSETLAIPYRNLASMYQELGNDAKSQDYEELAGKIKRDTQKK